MFRLIRPSIEGILMRSCYPPSCMSVALTLSEGMFWCCGASTHTETHTHTHIHTYTHTNRNTRTHTQKHTYTHTHRNTYTHNKQKHTLTHTHTHKGRTCFWFPCAQNTNKNWQRHSNEQMCQFCRRLRWILVATNSFRDRFFPDLSPLTSTCLEARNQELCLALILVSKLLPPGSQESS